ncbi:MAG: VWA domain-containing protein, partial [Actinomycetota bacterium]|nr:VWA domain-containing protein [Actinomycetota bacterium]
MTDQNLSHIYFLLDRSGSMTSIRTETIAGFDAFIAEQRKVLGKCCVTLAQFDDHYEEVYADRDVAAVPTLGLTPRGSTALLDALGRLIVTAGERMAAMPEEARPGSVVVGVMTDGYENASQDWTHERIKALTDQQTRQYGWEFLYLGADQDAIEEGSKMGFAASKSMSYGRGKTDKVMAD